MGKPLKADTSTRVPPAAVLGLTLVFFAALFGWFLLAASALAMALGQLASTIGQTLNAALWPLHVLLAVMAIIQSLEPAWDAVASTAGVMGQGIWLIVTHGEGGR